MNGWRSRITLAVIMLLAMHAHSVALANKPNTDAGLLAFHLSAAVIDLLIMKAAPRFVSGRLCSDMQILCLVSIVANFVGWIAYTAYAPPIFYNVFMWGLSYVQWGRLLLVDHHGADYLRVNLVRGGYRGRHQNLFGKATA
jgi:hypothetical protein